MKKIYIQSFVVITLLTFLGCSDVLDKKDLSAFTGEAVWSDPNLATGFINQLHNRSISTWPTTAAGTSDDAEGRFSIMYGEVPINSVNSYSGTYRLIFDINTLLTEVDTGSLDQSVIDLLKAQAYFYRARAYFNLISTYGGVPLVLAPSVSADGEALQVSRNSTSECMAQIIADLDLAIAGLPASWDAADYGRITSGAAMAYKGRILNHYASEQFDPNQTANRWQAAFDANSAARTALETAGKGLHPSFGGLWLDEGPSNVEAIIVRQYTPDVFTNRDAGARPFVVGTNGESWNKATISLVDVFPMKDGKAISDGTSAYTYDPVTFWNDRDPRFGQTISYNTAIWALNDPIPNRTSDIEWSFQESAIETQANSRLSQTSFNCRKAVDETVPGGAEAGIGTTDWIEMRFAEVLLNLAEAANEIGNSTLAYDILSDIRERAGIDAGGDGLYGLQAGMDQNQLRDAIMLERRIEFAFEGKRSYDLRRRRMYDDINGTIRRGYVIRKTAAFDALDPSDEVLDDRIALEEAIKDGTIDLNDPVQYETYFTTTIRSVERMGDEFLDGDPINYLDLYYFFDIPQRVLDRNPNIEQNIGYPGGTFDPLQ